MRASPALLRARAPYLLKNTITGIAICTLVIGICTRCIDIHTIPELTSADSYTINVISQDEFEDVIVPPEPMTTRPRATQELSTTESVRQAVAAAKKQ